MTDKEIRSGKVAIVQKQTEEALSESEERYRSILNASPDDITNTKNRQPGKGARFEIAMPTGA
jgi:PAS domain-containing protein